MLRQLLAIPRLRVETARLQLEAARVQLETARLARENAKAQEEALERTVREMRDTNARLEEWEP